jgi:hypothetical protein
MSIINFILYTVLVLTIIGLTIALIVITNKPEKKIKCPEQQCEVKHNLNRIAAKIKNYNFTVYLKSENNNTFFSTLVGCECPSDKFAYLTFDRENSNIPRIIDSEGKLLVFEFSDNEKNFYFTNKPLNETRKAAEIRFISDIGVTVTSSIGSTIYYLSYDEPLRNTLKCPLILPTKATTYKTILTVTQ